MSTDVAPRSLFVTVTGWAFIGVGAMGAFFCALMAMVTTMTQLAGEKGSRFGQPYQAMQQAVQTMPAPMPWLYAHQPWLLGTGAVLLLVHVGLAIGLLKRYNAARVAFLGLMLLDMVMQVASAAYLHAMQTVTQQVMLTQMSSAPSFFTTLMDHLLAFQRIEAILRPIGLIVLFGWITWRLRSPAIRGEFLAKPERATQALTA